MNTTTNTDWNEVSHDEYLRASAALEADQKVQRDAWEAEQKEQRVAFTKSVGETPEILERALAMRRSEWAQIALAASQPDASAELVAKAKALIWEINALEAAWKLAAEASAPDAFVTNGYNAWMC